MSLPRNYGSGVFTLIHYLQIMFYLPFKRMKFLLPVFAIVLLLSCSSEKNAQADDTVLLTSVSWERAGEGNPKTFSAMKINTDGTYEMTEEGYNESGTKVEVTITMRGTWKWGANREIITNNTEMVMNGESHKLDDKDHRYVLRITELSKDKLVGISRNIYDAEDSGFAYTESYVAKPM